VDFDEGRALGTAKDIVRMAIENYPHRDASCVRIPDIRSPLIAGFSAENICTALGGRYRPSYRPLNDAIISGRLRGLAAVVGCNNPKHQQDAGHLAITRELLANDVLVATTGCTAIADAKAGLMDAANRQERLMLDRRTYTDDMEDLGFDDDPMLTEEQYYSIDAEACADGTIATCYVLTATPVVGGVQEEDTKCTSLILDSTGAKTAEGTLETECW